MAREMDQKSRETWRKLLEQKQRSGLTVVAQVNSLRRVIKVDDAARQLGVHKAMR